MTKRNIWRVGAVVLSFTLFAAACGDSGSDNGGTAAPVTTAVVDDGAGATTTAAPADTSAPVDTVDTAVGGELLKTVQDRGTLNCGVSGSAVAFSETQPDGTTTGLDADWCRAVAAVVLGDSTAVNFVALTAAARFTAVQTGQIDVLMRNTTWTQSRDTDVGMDFGPTTYYDGQQLMARESDGFTGASTVADIAGATVCTTAGTTTEKNIAETAKVNGIDITLQTYEEYDIVMTNFLSGACNVITTDGSGLVGRKAKQQPAGENWVIFPAKPISKEPLGPTYGQNDSKWADAVNWTVYAGIIFDEQGVTSANVDAMVANPPSPEIGRLLGGDGELQTAMGLAPDAFQTMVREVGNYDEIFVRNLGPVGITRAGSSNASWNDGGLQFAPPAR